MFATLVDYAGLYPPAELSMAQAAPEYDTLRDTAFAWMLGRFILPATRIPELHGTEYPLSVVVDGGKDARAWLERTQQNVQALATIPQAEVLEVPLPPLQSRRDTYDALLGQFASVLEITNMRNRPAYMEIPRDDRWLELLPGTFAALKRYRLGAKIRCGGVTAEAFPSPEEVAAFLAAAAEANVALKATAGLHHPVRGLDPAGTGFLMHGFLNMLAGTLVARDDANAATVEAAIGEEDPAAFRFDETTFAWRDRIFDVAAIEAMRREGFIAYGSCSFNEPVEDLIAMGVLER
jgi:hypothetical protein